MEELMGCEEIRLAFENWADAKGFDLSIYFFKDEGNPYTEVDTKLAYEIWCSAIHSNNLSGFTGD